MCFSDDIAVYVPYVRLVKLNCLLFFSSYVMLLIRWNQDEYDYRWLRASGIRIPSQPACLEWHMKDSARETDRQTHTQSERERVVVWQCGRYCMVRRWQDVSIGNRPRRHDAAVAHSWRHYLLLLPPHSLTHPMSANVATNGQEWQNSVSAAAAAADATLQKPTEEIFAGEPSLTL